jgi:hypothetical protein
MSDGLEWLICDEPCKVMDARSGCHCAKARNKIDRLKAEVEQNAIARDEYRRVITEQASEIERLRNDVRLAVMSDSKECTAISEVNARLRAEVERLRAALIHARNQIQHPDQLIDEALEPRT